MHFAFIDHSKWTFEPIRVPSDLSNYHKQEKHTQKQKSPCVHKCAVVKEEWGMICNTFTRVVSGGTWRPGWHPDFCCYLDMM